MVRSLLVLARILVAKLTTSKKLISITERVLGLSRSVLINNSMADTKISQLPVANTVAQSEYILIDDGVVTRITPVINLSSLFTSNTNFNNLSTNSWNSTYTTVRTNSGSWIYSEQPATTLVKANSGLWDSTYSVMFSNSAYWINTSSVVSSSSAYWNSTISTVNTLSAELTTDVLEISSFVNEKFNKVTLGTTSTNIVLTGADSGKLITYSNTSNITAYITPGINTTGYTASLAQLSSGTIKIAVSGTYTTGNLITYGGLVETAGVGATANITRVADNTFLLTGLLQ